MQLNKNQMINFLVLIPPLFYIKFYGFNNIGVILTVISIPLIFILNINYIKAIKKSNLTISIPIIIFISYVGFINGFILDNFSFFMGTFWWVILVVKLLFFQNPNKSQLNNLIYVYIIISIIILSIDAYYRFYIGTLSRNDIGRYAYKFGLIDLDSNFSGIYATLIFFFTFYYSEFNKKVKVFLPFLFFLVCLSMSVASISTTILCYSFIKLRKILKYILLAFCISIFPVVFHEILYYVGSDGSGSTKIALLLNGFVLFSDRGLIDILFGTGFDSVRIYGFAPHLLILQLLLEFGLVGLIIFSSIIITFIFKSRDYLYIIIPYIILGMSVSSISNPIFTTTLLLMTYIIRANGKVINN